MSRGFIDKDRGLNRITKKIAALHGTSVAVGIMGNAGAMSNGISVVDYAAFNEFGTAKIPARPFMGRTFDTKSESITKYAEYLVGRLIDNTQDSIERVLSLLGAQYQQDIMNTIESAGSWAAPNSAYTIMMKGSSSPLIDTGRLINSIRYQVSI